MSNMASLENPRTGAEFAGNIQKKMADLPAMFDDTGGYQDVHQQNNPQLPAESLPPTPSEEPLGKVQTVHPCSKPKLKKTNPAEEKHAKQKPWENASVDLRINHVIIPKKLNWSKWRSRCHRKNRTLDPSHFKMVLCFPLSFFWTNGDRNVLFGWPKRDASSARASPTILQSGGRAKQDSWSIKKEGNRTIKQRDWQLQDGTPSYKFVYKPYNNPPMNTVVISIP